eukprot:CCRYP_017305-RA/>CCRYP_017305-RA protein AED:0.00 eAED:0.00 QI:137/1/1/1/0/0/2/29/37
MIRIVSGYMKHPPSATYPADKNVWGSCSEYSLFSPSV